jgi:hypothetical protein
MPWYGLAKIVHYLGFIALIGSFVIYPRAGVRLRSATTTNEVQQWLGMLELTRGMVHGGAVMMLLSGIIMGMLRWKAPVPFMVIGLITLVAVWVLWVLIPGKHLRAVRTALGEGGGPVSAELSRTIRQPRPWAVALALNLAVLGVLFEMTLKLGWPGAITLVVVMTILGATIGFLVVRRENAQAVALMPNVR